MKKVYATKEEARQKRHIGFLKVADAVISTLGPAGRNTEIERPYQDSLITNDGKTTAEHFILDDEIEDLGASRVRKITKTTSDGVNDATTTTTAIDRQLSIDLMSKLESNTGLLVSRVNTMQLRREVLKASKQAIELIKAKTKPATDEDLLKVATCAMEDKDIAKTIVDLCKKVGKDGVISIEDDYGYDILTEVTDGLEIEHGFVADDMGNDKGIVEFTKVPVLLTNVKLSSNLQITPLINKLIENGHKELVIFADAIEKEIVTSMVITKLSGDFHVVAIKIPAGRPEILKDIQSIVGGEIVDAEKNMTIENSFEKLGLIKKIKATKNKTTLTASVNPKEYVKKLEAEMEKSTSLFDKDRLQQRIAKLTGGIGVIKVGATTQDEREYLKLKIHNAKNSTLSAMKGGYIKGGGLTLKEVAEEMGDSIISNALKAPYNIIQENNGEPLEIGDDVLDASLSIQKAVEVACADASLAITIDTVIATKREKEKDYENS